MNRNSISHYACAAFSNASLNTLALSSVLTFILNCIGSCPSNPRKLFTVLSKRTLQPLVGHKVDRYFTVGFVSGEETVFVWWRSRV